MKVTVTLRWIFDKTRYTTAVTRTSDSVYTPRRAEWVCWIAENSATRPMLIKRSTTTTAAAGEGKIYYTAYRYIVTTSRNDSCMGSGESHFNVSLIVREKVTRQCPQTTKFLMRKESRSGIVPRSFRLPAYHLSARPNRLSEKNETFERLL